MNFACVLLIKISLRGIKASEDVELVTSRTLTFLPVEGTVLVFSNEQDEEYELTLGTPRYEFAESAFVEYQEDDTWLEDIRCGESKDGAKTAIIKRYESFGFRVANHETRVIKAIVSI